jgi:predicted CXXCH cytochrome family protein
MGFTRSASLLRAAALLALAGSLGCVDEKIVYRDGPNFAAPPQAAASFIGYDDQAAKLTVCGNCHVGQQGKWKTTAHASAWKTLDDNAGKRGTCERCHTVNNLGNVATDTAAGWRSTKDARYQDVQCESCHGAGLQHVGTPTRGQMLASVKADTGASVTNGCGECHSGTHHGFVDDWRQTRHATARTSVFNSTTSTPPVGEVAGGPRGACQSCHIGQKVLEAWGVSTNYTEKAAAINCATAVNGRCVGNSTAIGSTCIVCHDPHGSTYPAQLRFPIDSRDPELNLCVKCHNRRGTFDINQSSNLSPHAPHGPLVFGTAGWWPPGLSFEETESSHGTERNPKLCAQCHIAKYDVTDKSTNAFVVTVTGHRFTAIPCVDANGRPTPDQTCTQVSQRSFRSCAASGCHSEASARTAFVAAESDIALLRGALNAMLQSPLIPASQKSTGVTTYRGSMFNYNLAGSHGAEAHNPFLVKALLRASIAQVNKDYGVALPPGLSIAPYDKLILGRAN